MITAKEALQRVEDVRKAREEKRKIEILNLCAQYLNAFMARLSTSLIERACSQEETSVVEVVPSNLRDVLETSTSFTIFKSELTLKGYSVFIRLNTIVVDWSNPMTVIQASKEPAKIVLGSKTVEVSDGGF